MSELKKPEILSPKEGDTISAGHEFELSCSPGAQVRFAGIAGVGDIIMGLNGRWKGKLRDGTLKPKKYSINAVHILGEEVSEPSNTVNFRVYDR
jgi:hypothetical protein